MSVVLSRVLEGNCYSIMWHDVICVLTCDDVDNSILHVIPAVND